MPPTISRVRRIRDRLVRGLERNCADGETVWGDAPLLKALLAGFGDRVARRRAPSGDQLVLGRGGSLKLELWLDRIVDLDEVRFDTTRERVERTTGLTYEGISLDESQGLAGRSKVRATARAQALSSGLTASQRCRSSRCR